MTLALAMMAASTNALLWMPPTTSDLASTFFDLAHAHSRAIDLAHSRAIEKQRSYQLDPSPYWTSSADAYELKMRLSDIEPQSVSAALASDGKKIELTARRKIEGCECKPAVVEQIALPYRPRAEDIAVTVKSDILSLKLARRASADESTPLEVTVQDKAPEAKEGDDSQTPAGTRPLRFVPHESANEVQQPSVDEQEKSLTAKFRKAALASLATTPSSGAQDTAAGEKAAADAGAADAPNGNASVEQAATSAADSNATPWSA